MKTWFTLIFLLTVNLSYAQVSAIKSASSSNSSSSNGDDYSSNGGDGAGWFGDFLFGGIVEWQKFKLTEYRQRYPSMVSVDVMLQGAIKPSSYYILLPRVRGNWGLFSTDFRMNYLIEEGPDGFIHIRTNDWQILQLNLITHKFFTFRVGAGIMQEAFGGNRTFNENSFQLFIHAPDQSKNLGFEYRFSKNWDTGVNPRRELGVQYQHQLFCTRKLHGYATVGAVYQRYYNTINVWGIQGGLAFRLF
jgi:cellulase/cellobiase CelA1